MRLGFPVGLQHDISQWVQSASVTLESGDGIVLYTDGIPEAANAREELYGIERLCALISRHWQESADHLRRVIIADVTNFIGAQKLHDDLTLVVLKQQ
jgi:serine phosphatase RsbU (regulator of sigma subunit)